MRLETDLYGQVTRRDLVEVLNDIFSNDPIPAEYGTHFLELAEEDLGVKILRRVDASTLGCDMINVTVMYSGEHPLPLGGLKLFVKKTSFGKESLVGTGVFAISSSSTREHWVNLTRLPRDCTFSLQVSEASN